MKFKHLIFIFLVIANNLTIVPAIASFHIPDPYTHIRDNHVKTDTIPLKERFGDHITDKSNNPFDLNTTEIQQKVEFDPITGQYIVFEKVGDQYVRTPTYLTFEEYLSYKSKEQESNYFKTLAGIKSEKKSLLGRIDPMDKIDLGNSLVDRLFGGTEVNIQPQGTVDLSVGWLYSRFKNPILPLRAQRQSQLDFPTPLIKMSVDGKIGKKLDLNFNYDTQSNFDFDRIIKLGFDSQSFSEDDIIKKIEAGNVSLPLRGNLIQGAQSLMGLKTELQFGRLRITGIASQQRSKNNNIKIENGEAVQDFEIYADQYDENRHFFLSQYNRDTYERSLSKRYMPYINTSHQIVQIEVWVSDDRQDFQGNTAMIAAISDLGEPNPEKFTSNPDQTLFPPTLRDETGKPLPRNEANNIYQRVLDRRDIEDIDKISNILTTEFGMQRSRDFEVFRGRKLSPSEYTYHPKLGTISLNSRLRANQVLGISYNYYYTTLCDSLFQVGMLSSSSLEPANQSDTTRVEPTKVHFVKLIKSTNQTPTILNGKNKISRSPQWELMMKNVYPLNTSSLNPKDFVFDIYYEDDFNDGSLKKYLPESGASRVPLLQLFNLDNLNRVNDPQPDGYFDYIPGVTVIERSGSIIIPVLEPFGSHLDTSSFKMVDPSSSVSQQKLDSIYKFQMLYDTSISIARTFVVKNKFTMRGRVKSSTNNGEYPLGPFVPQGSVRVTAGGRPLIEGQDYEIDYGAGRLRIINQSILSLGTPINISFEDNSAFNLQQKRMLGMRAEYTFNKKSSLGLTYLKVFEIPYTFKVNIQDDPIKNRMLGLDYNLDQDVPWLTKWADKLPFYSTSQKSKINLTSEVAVLLPGHAKGINTSFDKTGIANLDDFEGAVNTFNLGGFATNQWVLASTPENLVTGEGKLNNDINVNVNRAKFNWYSLDFGLNRSALDNNDPFTAQISQTQFFPNRNTQPGQNIQFTFDLSFYPQERGPYNFDTRSGIAGISRGFTVDPNTQKIVLNNPETRWGGIMRYFPNADFEAANYESIEFWIMNPFEQMRGSNHDPNEEGEIVFNLGNISEDIMKDNFLFFENAISTSQRRVPELETPFGRATVSIPLVNGFDLQEGKLQDLGFDGISDNDERLKYEKWMVDNQVSNLASVASDPSNDNFVFFNDPALQQETNLRFRMKDFNGAQGNAPLDNGNNQNFVRGNSTPDTEDLNNNKTLDQTESFYEYRLRIKNNNGELDTLALGKYFRQFKIVNTGDRPVKWYRIQIPISEPAGAINGISGFRSIQFMRMYVTNFSTPKTFRLLDFQMQRSQWRRLPSTCRASDAGKVEFTIDDVGIEENSDKLPFNYIPPVNRTSITSSFGQFFQDEKSLVLKYNDLQGGCEIKVNKLIRNNLSLYKRLQLYVHAESLPKVKIPDGDLSFFIRIGKDHELNYYEYELPLKMSDQNIGAAVDSNVWPLHNYINILLDSFLILKKERIVDQGQTNVERSLIVNPIKGDKVKLVGNPSLAAVKSIVLGVRNNKDSSGVYSGEVWVNELRVTGYDESAAFAAQSKMQVQIADLAEINVSGAYNSTGFGGLQDRLHDRLREEVLRYDIGANIDIGKVLPKSLKLNIPLYAQYQKEYITPQYDPYDQDIEVREKLDLVKDRAKRDEIKETAREETTIKTFNLTNVKTQLGSQKYPWSPSNFSATYAYTENIKSDPIIKEDKSVNQNIGLDYGYNRKSTYIEPLKFIKPKALKLLSDFNFSLLPSTFTFTTRMTNLTNSRTFRLPVSPVFVFDDQRFNWERNYVLNWDLTRSLRLNFRANSTSVIDQIRQVGIANTAQERTYVDPFGRDVTQNVIDDPNFIRDYRNTNIKNLGRSKNYDHNFSINYKLPFKNIPGMDWIQGTIDYKADYAWQGGSLIVIDALDTPLGNIIKNGQNGRVNFTFSFDRLYNKIPYLKAIETGKAVTKKSKNTGSGPKMIRKKSDKEDANKAPEMAENELKSDDEGNDNKSKKESKPKKEEKPRDPTIAERIVLRPLMLLRNVKLDFTDDRSTIIPGFMPQSSLFGLSDGFTSPGWDFAAGIQPRLEGDNNWLDKNQKWFNNSLNFNEALQQQKRIKVELRATLEPVKSFNVDVTMKRNFNINHTEVFRTKSGTDKFMQLAKYDVGSFDATFFALNTLFNESQSMYDIFKSNREVISRRLPNVPNPGLHPSDPRYTQGYGPTSNTVNVTAFMAAYRGISAYDIPLDQQKDFSRDNFIPMPNWQVNYVGLEKVKPFKKIFTNISIKHGYTSTIRINDFRTDAQYQSNDPFRFSTNDNYFSRFEMSSVVISEQFTPIIGISIKTIKDMKIDFEFKKSRTLDLTPTILRETNNEEITFGAGYTVKGVKMKSSKKKKISKKKKGDEEDDQDSDSKNNNSKDSKFPSLNLSKNKGVTKSRDLKFNVTYSLRDDLSVEYNLQTGINGQSDRGAKTVTLNPTVEYDLNNNLSLRFYFDYSKSLPKTTNSFPTTTIRSGITFRFNIN
jgi:cell surface protein SprA